MAMDCIDTLRPRQNGRNSPDDIFKYIFLNENEWISIKISLKFVPKGQINNIPSLVQIMAWRRPGDKPLSEPMMVSLPTHICVTRPQWVNLLMNEKISDGSFVDWALIYYRASVDLKTITSSNGNIFPVTGPLWGESTGHRWIPLTKASDTELWCFLWYTPEQTVMQTTEMSVIWDPIMLIMMSLLKIKKGAPVLLTPYSRLAHNFENCFISLLHWKVLNFEIYLKGYIFSWKSASKWIILPWIFQLCGSREWLYGIFKWSSSSLQSYM